MTCEPMTVAVWQEKLLKKLILDGLSNWTPRNMAAARELILDFHDIFMLDGKKLSCTSAIEHKIHINYGEPFKERFRCIPPLLLEEVHTPLSDMLDVRAICPSQSPWCNMVVLVWKKDGSTLLHGFLHSMHMTKRTHTCCHRYRKHWRAWRVLYISQQWTLRLNFGLCNAPMTFQCLMQNTLGELNLTYCIIYLDDVIVFGCMEEEHLECLCVLFERFCEFNLKLKPSKCSFFQSEIVYLAHHVSCEGFTPVRKTCAWWSRDLHPSPCILFLPLQAFHQGIH